MSLNVQSYKNAAYPPPLHMPQEQPSLQAPADFRRFVLRWNSRKTPGRNPRKNEWQECYGTLYPPGCEIRISLSNGQQFPTQDEMEYVLNLGGDHTIDWIDA